MDFYTILLILITVIFTGLIVLISVLNALRIKQINEELKEFLFSTRELTPVEFNDLRTQKKGNTYISKAYNIPGVYILENHSDNMFYVGQGKKVLDRVHSHFSGRGNGDVYADFKYGAKFTIKIIPLQQTNYTNLNDLEREYIRLLGAYTYGYNKNRGNKSY